MAANRICVLDAGPIIHLDELGSLDLLTSMGELFVPETVADEADTHRPGVMQRLGIAATPDVEGTSTEVLALAIRRRLHAGEVAALSWADAFGADLFLSDDGDARLAADELGYRSVGTLGVIRAAANDGRLSKSDAIHLLQSVPSRSTLHVTARFLARTIADLR